MHAYEDMAAQRTSAGAGLSPVIEADLHSIVPCDQEARPGCSITDITSMSSRSACSVRSRRSICIADTRSYLSMFIAAAANDRLEGWKDGTTGPGSNLARLGRLAVANEVGMKELKRIG